MFATPLTRIYKHLREERGLWVKPHSVWGYIKQIFSLENLVTKEIFDGKFINIYISSIYMFFPHTCERTDAISRPTLLNICKRLVYNLLNAFLC
jgi:hypothetical protein